MEKQHTATLTELQEAHSAEIARLQSTISAQPLQSISAIVKGLQCRTELAQLEQGSLDAVKRNADAKLQHLQQQLDVALQQCSTGAHKLQQQQASAQQQEHDMQLLRKQLSGVKQQCLSQLNAMQQQLDAANQQHEGDQVVLQQQQETSQLQADQLQALQGVIYSAEQRHVAVNQQHAAEKRELVALRDQQRLAVAQQHAEHAEEVQTPLSMLADAKQQCDVATAVQQQQALQLQSVLEQLDISNAELAEKSSTVPQQQQQQLFVADQQALHLQPLQADSDNTTLQPASRAETQHQLATMHQSAAQLGRPAEQLLSVAKKRRNGSSAAAVQSFQLMAELNAQHCSSAMLQSQQTPSAASVVLQQQQQQQPHRKLQGLRLALQLFVHEAEQVMQKC